MTDDANYNDEFLPPGTADHARATEVFGPLMFALFSQKIWDEFRTRDTVARGAKRAIYRFGIGSIVLGLLALALATIDIAYLAPQLEFAVLCKLLDAGPRPDQCTPFLLSVMSADSAETFVKVVAGAAALLGVLSFVTGFWQGGFGSRKRRWLSARMCCELIRQWRWRYYLEHLEDVVAAAGNEARETAYQEAQDAALDAFLRDLEADLPARLEHAIEHGRIDLGEDETPIRKPPLDTTPQSGPKGERLALALKAYDDVRIRGQIWYATYLTEKSGRFGTHPARQKSLLHEVETALVVLVLFAHLLVVLGVLADVAAFKSVFVHTIAITMALAALAVTAIDRGLRPEAHLGRFLGYKSQLLATRDRFREATTPPAKIASAQDVERAAYDEMIDFLREANAARFVI
ncbi:MAG: hypothetical protein AAGA71_17285 [Pseudomonadota bacterium]